MRWGPSIAAMLILPVACVAAPASDTADPGAPPTSPPPPVTNPQPPAAPPAAKNQPRPPSPVAEELAGKVAREIQFRGNTRLSSERLLELMRTRPDQPIDPAALEQDLTRLEEAYHADGYTLMRALSPEPLAADGVLVIPIQEGVVESVEVVGNRKTRRYVILRLMDTRPGDVYNENSVRDDRERIAGLGVFRDVQVGSAPGKELGKAVVSVRVIEARTAEIATTLGYNSRTGLLGYFYGEEQNLYGTGQQVSARWERLTTGRRSSSGSAFQMTYFTPFSPLPKTSFRITGYQTSPFRFVYATSDIDLDQVRTFEIRRGGAVQLARELTVRNHLIFGFRNDDVEYDRLPLDVEIPRGYSTDVGTIRVLLVGLTNDTRDLRFDPHKGGYHSFNVEFGNVAEGGGNFVRYTAGIRRYRPAGKARVWASRLLVGTSSGDLPLPELYYLGGPDSLRGYNRDQFYGRSMVALNSELRVPIGTGMQLVGFVDAGRASGSGGTRASVGVGFRVVTPIGPLRIDLAVGSEGARSHFTAGYVAF